MVAHHVKIKESAIGGEDQAHSKPSAAFVETFAQGANADSTMAVRIAERCADAFHQFSDLFALSLAEQPQCSQQIGIEFNL